MIASDPMQLGASGLIPAVAYVRMSTEHQQYSTENQLERMKDFAARRGMVINRVFADEGKSGLSVRGRESLRQLISEVESGQADFKCILVYDVSRWGRFQDADESGYYEYICKRAGITVHYCAEQFENDGSPASNIIKSVKRSMAGEYSRELSVKVFEGACRLIQRGFKQGGSAGFGLRRMLIDPSGAHKGALKKGEQKNLQTDRVVLVPGPPDEVAVVREIYHLFVHEGKRESAIAASLNARKIFTDLGRPWRRGTIHGVLTNEKYIGNILYHRTSFRLKRKHIRNPPELWIRSAGAFPGIVDAALFARAQEIIRVRLKHFTEEQMLHGLKDLLRRHGRISGSLIDGDERLPSSSSFRNHFGSVIRAYQLVGYTHHHDLSFRLVNRVMREKRPGIVQQVITRLAAMRVPVEHDPVTDLLVLDHELTVSIVLARCFYTEGGGARWLVRFERSFGLDLTIVVRMDEANREIKDYYLFPAIDRPEGQFRISDSNHALLDAYRFDDLEFFFAVAERIPLEEAA